MTTKTKKDFKINAPLPILYSCRIRLDESQRETLREAHRKFRKQFQPAPQQAVLAGSSVSVETTYAPPVNAYAEAGLSDLICSDLIGTRESIPLTTVVQIQNLFGVEVISRKDLEKKFADYLDWVLD